MTDKEKDARIRELEAQNAALKAKNGGGALRCKVSDKGGLSVYNLGRFPVTLYKEQWNKLIAYVPEISAFLKEHDGELKAKGE